MGFLKRICLKRISAAGEKTSPGLLRRGVREMVRSYKGPDSRRGDVLILFEMDYAQIASALYGLRRKEMYRDYMEICGSLRALRTRISFRSRRASSYRPSPCLALAIPYRALS